MMKDRAVKHKRPASLVAATLALGLSIASSGCQTVGENATSGATFGAALGCVIGAATAKDSAKGCAAGTALGGAAGYYLGHQRDLKLAKSTQKEIEDLGVANVSLNTGTYNYPSTLSGAHGASSSKVVSEMIIEVPQERLSRRDPTVSDSLERIGNYVSRAEAAHYIAVATRTEDDYRFIVDGIIKGYSKEVSPSKVAFNYKPKARGPYSSIALTPSD